jgi:FkbM family methyltransferase
MKISKYIRTRISKLGWFDKFVWFISDYSVIENVLQNEGRLNSLTNFELEFISKIIENKYLKKYSSQIGQDIFIDILNSKKEKGFFIEIGVGDGVNISNTYFLEKIRNWNGVLCEPDKSSHSSISANRKATLCKDALFNKAGTIDFYSIDGNTELSTINMTKDMNSSMRKNYSKYEVNTLTFGEFAIKYNIPTSIDFISLDTEGTELEILSTIDFSKYQIGAFCIEHNNLEDRKSKLKEIMFSNGYNLFNEKLTLFDYWFYK